MKAYGVDDGKDCSDVSWEASIAELRNTTVSADGGVGIRQWIYQTCTQFGYCNSSSFVRCTCTCTGYVSVWRLSGSHFRPNLWWQHTLLLLASHDARQIVANLLRGVRYCTRRSLQAHFLHKCLLRRRQAERNSNCVRQWLVNHILILVFTLTISNLTFFV